MLCKEKCPVCSEIHTRHINYMDDNVEFFNVKPCGM